MTSATSLRIATCALALLLPVCAQAQSRSAQPGQPAESPFDGAYLSIQGTYTFGGDENDGGGADGTVDLPLDGWGAAAAIGFGRTYGIGPADIYLGVEGEFGYSFANTGDPAGTASVAAALDGVYGLTARAGWLPNARTMLFGQVGWGRSNIDVDVGSASAEVGLDAVRYGGGVEWQATSGLGLRLDYFITDPGSETVRLGPADVEFSGSYGTARVGIVQRF